LLEFKLMLMRLQLRAWLLLILVTAASCHMMRKAKKMQQKKLQLEERETSSEDISVPGGYRVTIDASVFLTYLLFFV
jgi:hypothetical protein